MKMKGGEMSPLVSFILGAAVATVCVLFFMSASPGGRLVDLSAFTSSSRNTHDDHLLEPVLLQESPAPAPVEVPYAALFFFLFLSFSSSQCRR
jgi:hypothetical protein